MPSELVWLLSKGNVAEVLEAYRPRTSAIAAMTRRWIYRTVVPGWIRLGISASQSIKLMRHYGVGFRRQDMLKTYKDIKAKEGKRAALNALLPDALPTPDMFSVSPNLMPTTYRFVLKMERVNPVTGKLEQRHISVYSNKLFSSSQFDQNIDLIMSIQKYGSEDTGYNVISIEEAYKNPVY